MFSLIIYFTHSINSVCMSIPIAQFLLLPLPSFFKKNLIYLNGKLITLQYYSGFCHILTWISHGVTCVPHLEPPSHLPPHPIPLGHPSAPALSTLSHASKLDRQSTSHMIIYMFQCYSLKSSHTHLNDWNCHSDHWYTLEIPRKLWDVDCLQDVLIMSI